MTKTTTWEDPRKTIYNLPSNQCDISADLRAHIKATISLPTGWEEAMTPQGERYYINHNSRTTSWEDPRLSKLDYIILNLKGFIMNDNHFFTIKISICNKSRLSIRGIKCLVLRRHRRRQVMR